MADLFALRDAWHAAQQAAGAAAAVLAQRQAAFAGAQATGLAPTALLASLHAQVVAQTALVTQQNAARDAAQAAYQAAVAADPLHAIDASVPLLLLPVRIETAYLPAAAGSGALDLVLRIYPDDIHVDTHEPALSAAELAAGTAYWNAVWGAGANAARLDAAWQGLLARLKPNRAAWVVQALAPAAPRPTQETPADAPQPVPQLPTVESRADGFTRAARTMLLPDRWIALGWRAGSLVFNASGSAIADALDISFGPPGSGAATEGDGPFDAASRWLVDLDAAIAAGMALRIPLSGPDYSVDQLYVFGARSGLSAADAAARVETLLVAHQYTHGIEFLPPGTPTNNTSATRSAWQSAALPPAPAQVEQARAGYAAASAQNAALTAKALGVDGLGALCIAPQALDDQVTPVQVLHRQLWPALGGKVLSMLYWQWDTAAGAPNAGWHLHDNPAATAALQEHATGWVLSRGMLPVLRVGRQPYGLLPTSSLADWAVPAGDASTTLVDWLRRVRPYWLAGLENLPRVVPGAADPDNAVLNMLARLPVSPALQLRADGDPIAQEVANLPFPQAVIPGLPMNSEMYFASPGASSQPMPVAFVDDAAGDLQAMQQLAELFADALAVLQQTQTSAQFAATYKTLLSTGKLADPPPPDLFVSMLSDSFTDPLVDSEHQVAAGLLFGALGFDGNKGDPAFLQRVQALLPQANAFVASFRATTALGSTRPTIYAELLPELLDIYSHRYDAWVTSLASRRLAQMRAAVPAGLAIGGYGWVENLAPRSDLTAVPAPAGTDGADGNATVYTSARQHYIHAPSLHHAATAAVLRAGFDSHADPDALAVSLTSSRVRTADALAAGIRNGQSLGALLGYRFERGLHDGGRDVLIDALRRAYPTPLPTGPDAEAPDATARDAIAARNVVDGLALYRQRDAVAAAYAAEPVVLALLQALADAVDALGDLLLAESVHHLVGGNPLRAGLAADTVGRGEPVPDRFDVIRTPRSGRALTWQLGVLLPAAWQAAVPGWRSDRPRARIEPRLDAWVATLLGDAARYRIACLVAAGAGAAPTELSIGADTLGLAALDVLAESNGAPSLLERRVATAVMATQAPGSVVAVQTGPNADGSLGFAELAGLAQRLAVAIAGATPLGPAQLQGPDAAVTAGLDSAELAGRVQGFLASFAAAAAALTNALPALQSALDAAGDATTAAAAVRTALTTVADHGLAVAFPAGDAAAALLAQANAVSAMAAPLAATVAPPAPAADATDAQRQAWLGALRDVLRPIAGGLLPLLPVHGWAADSPIATSLAPAQRPAGADAVAIGAWLRRVAAVRPASAALHDGLLAAESFGAGAAAWVATQTPAGAGAPWAALPYAAGKPPAARLASVWHAPAAIDAAGPVCGLLLDRWVETLPGLVATADPKLGYEPAEITGLAFTVDAPDAYAPQAMLLALAPDPAQGWSLDVLSDVLQETFELAKLRGVDLGDLPRLGRILPALHSGSNVDDMLNKAGVKT